MIPTGRNLYIWRLSRCEGGDIDAIVTRCWLAGITGLFIKAGDQGKLWNQFTPELVGRLHAAGIKVYGWSYDVPDKIASQVKVVQAVKAMGADGYLIDAEVEWDRNAAEAARRYAAGLSDFADNSFSIFDAPWDVPKYHPTFPFAEFASVTTARCPQNYHIAHGISARASWNRFIAAWLDWNRRNPDMVCPLVPSLSVWGAVTVDDIRILERLAHDAGCPGILHWEWSQAPARIWAAWQSGVIPPWGD